ncbi:MAG: hypothetical protein K2Q15_05055 [Burkholderiales bacterium]|nr:hypothetical protein [Burkholderiales bacterium]
MYGKQQLELLAVQLSTEYGKCFNMRSLRDMRAFYLAYPIRNAVSSELSWTYYRMMLRVENTQVREWYMHETAKQN